MDGHDGHGPDHGGGAGHAFDLGALAAGLGGHGHAHGSHSHSVGHAPGATHGHSGWAFGIASAALSHSGVMDSVATRECTDAQIGVRLPGVVLSDRTMQLLVWPHGLIDTQALFRTIASRHKLLSLSRKTPATVASNRQHKTLLDTKVFDGPGKNSQPSAKYEGATGTTTVWNEFWQLPTQRAWWSSKTVDDGLPLGSHLVIMGYTWFYAETGDYETRVAITVTKPNTCVAGEWKPVDEDAVRRHLATARSVALELFDQLSKVNSAEYSKVMRELQNHDRTPVCGPLGCELHHAPTHVAAPRFLPRHSGGDIIRDEMR